MEASPAVTKAAAAENRIIGVRLAIIAFNVTVYWTALDRTGHPHGLAVAVSLVASAYAVLVVSLHPRRRAAILQRSWFTVAGDSVLITLWLYATGGVDSVFYPLWAVSLVAVAFRFGPRVTAAATVLYALLDASVVAVGLGAVGPALEAWPRVTVRATYVVFTGLLGVLVARETSDQVRRRLEMEAEGARWRIEEERLRSLTDAAMEGIVLHEDGRVVDANPSYARLVGASLDSLRGHPEPILGGRTDRGPFELEYSDPRAVDEPARLLRVQQRPLLHQDREVLVAAVRDVTEERRAERDRQRAREQGLEIQRLQDMDRFKTEFINNAAHELNTPLTPLKLQLHLLRRSGGDAIAHNVDILERNLDRLGGLVQDMLDVAKLQSGRLRIDLRCVDLGRAVRDVVETYHPDADARGVALRADDLDHLTVHADVDRVDQILHNLLSNAIKFTPVGGTVHVRAVPDGASVLLTVTDTGLGLTEGQLKRLFQPFGQVHEDPAQHGTGLGLYISHNLAASMGGSMWCESDGPDKGARFHVLLPVAPADEVVEAAPDAQRP